MICSSGYKKDDYITSCKLSNINKHSFHKQCIKDALKYQQQGYYNYHSTFSGYRNTCPYCGDDIKSLKYVKITS